VLSPANGSYLGNFCTSLPVRLLMESGKQRTGPPEWLIVLGGSVFVAMLGLSAYWEKDIRWLHFFQAWMYIAAMALSLGGSRWGHFIGVSAAGLWDYANIFATTFFFNGLDQLSTWVRTGHLARPDILIAVPAWFSNLLVVAGCVWAYSRRRQKPRADIGRFLVAFVLTTGFFALDMAAFQPRYLGIFPRLLHPHLP
jgi:hypothetical protein